MDSVRAKRIAAELRGQSIGGWLVGEYLGNDASAVVLTTERDGQTGALKLIDPEMEERYGAAQQVARIELQRALVGHAHQHLIQIFDGGRCPETNYLYLAMELLAYPPLTALVPRFPREQIGPVTCQVASAACYLEGRGLAHRDIKPDNIVITRDCERAVLLDVGVLRPLVDPGELDADTGDAFLGTTRYSPPEFIMREEENNELGWRAITFYQLGAVLHDLIMQRRLFDEIRAPPARLIEAVRFSQPVIDAPDVPAQLVSLARNCLQKDWRLRIELVQWKDFEGGSPPVRGVEAKERIRRRLAIVSEHMPISRASSSVPPQRKVLEELGGSVATMVREICLEAGTFPPLDVRHSTVGTERYVKVRTDLSERHSLVDTLEICLALTILDQDGLVVRVGGITALGTMPNDIPPETWVKVYAGEASAPTMRARLDDFLHLALDAAQNAGGSATSGAFLRLPSLE
jgi:eukaryotic-like serine/threonine-protein kinase